MEACGKGFKTSFEGPMGASHFFDVHASFADEACIRDLHQN